MAIIAIRTALLLPALTAARERARRTGCAGKLPPLVGLAFSWSTFRDCDVVCVGTTSPYEAAEVVELSLSILERRAPNMELQATRRKASVAK